MLPIHCISSIDYTVGSNGYYSSESTSVDNTDSAKTAITDNLPKSISDASTFDKNLKLNSFKGSVIVSDAQTQQPLENKVSLSNSSEASVNYAPDEYDHIDSSLIYSQTSIPGAGIDDELFDQIPSGCDCSVCVEGSACTCLSRTPLSYNLNKRIKNNISWPVYECNENCGCSSNCLNRVVQNGPRKYLQIIKVFNETNSDSIVLSKGYGVVTDVFIPSGSFICEYAGEIIGETEAKSLFAVQDKYKSNNYVMVLREHYINTSVKITIIDPTKIGNIGRYLNHSCAPNVQVVPVRINSMVPVAGIFAINDIEPRTELTYDYGSSSSNLSKISLDERVECYCASENCRGYLPVERQLFE